jgi:hypothetical protein
LLQVNQLSGLIELINGDLSKLDRKKLITLCTIDVHARDVVQRLIDERVESATCFQWQSQMRYMVSEKTKLCQVSWQGVIGLMFGLPINSLDTKRNIMQREREALALWQFCMANTCDASAARRQHSNCPVRGGC